MKRVHIYKASIWCILTVLLTDAFSYWRNGSVVFLDIEYLSNPILLLIFLLILGGMVLGFAKFLSYKDTA